MSIDRDLTDLVRSWLKTDEHESADRVLGAVFDHLDSTPQRLSTWEAWRKNLMSGTLKLVAAGTAIVLVVAIALAIYLSRPAVGPVGSSSPSLQPSPTVPNATATASPTTEPTLAVGPNAPWVVFLRNNPAGGSTTPDDLWAIRADGTDGHVIFAGLRLPSVAWSPDGRQLLVEIGIESNPDVSHVYVAQVNDSIGQFVDTGFQASDGTACRGSPCQTSAFSLAPDGQHVVYVQTCQVDPPGCGYLTILDLRTGVRTELTDPLLAGSKRGPVSLSAWSPDGTQIAFVAEEADRGPKPAGDSYLYVVGADGQNLRRIDLEIPRVMAPHWSRDGQTLVFMSDSWPTGDELERNIYTVRADGTDLRQLTTDGISAWPEWVGTDLIRFRYGPLNPERAVFRLIDADGSHKVDLVDLDDPILALDPPGFGASGLYVPGDPASTFFWQPAPAWYQSR